MNRRQFAIYGAGALGLAMAPPWVAHQRKERGMMKIKLTSVFVEDQAKALDFYTRVLGFQKKRDEPAGEFRWLTVVSPDEPDGTELLLEPNANPAAKTFQQALVEQGIPLTAFVVEDVDAAYELLKGRGVSFRVEPTAVASTRIAVFDDTCGNLIQIFEM